MTTHRDHHHPRSVTAWFLGRPARVYTERFARHAERPAARTGLVT